MATIGDFTELGPELALVYPNCFIVPVDIPATAIGGCSLSLPRFERVTWFTTGWEVTVFWVTRWSGGGRLDTVWICFWV